MRGGPNGSPLFYALHVSVRVHAGCNIIIYGGIWLEKRFVWETGLLKGIVAEVEHDPVVLAKRAALAATALFIHTALIAAAIATVYGTEKWIHFLWSDTDPLLFDRVPYRFLFQAIDCVFIGLFGGMGVRDAFHILKGER